MVSKSYHSNELPLYCPYCQIEGFSTNEEVQSHIEQCKSKKLKKTKNDKI